MNTRGQLIPEIGREFLLGELKVGITFAQMALSMHNVRDWLESKGERCTRNARDIYESFLHFRDNATVSDADSAELQKIADELKRALVQLGEPLD